MDRKTLYTLVDELPEAELPAARRFLEYLQSQAEDPFRAVLETAPLEMRCHEKNTGSNSLCRPLAAKWHSTAKGRPQRQNPHPSTRPATPLFRTTPEA